MRMVLLTSAYPPYPEVGAIRAHSIVESLLEHGHEVVVITAALSGAADSGVESAERLRVKRLRLGTSFPSRIADFSLRIGIRSPAADTVETLRPRVSSQANSNPIVRTVLALLSLPDGAQHMIAPFVRAATEVLEEGADVLYTTSPPYSLALAGLLLRQRFNIPWVAELRDPWVHPWTDRQAASHPLTRTVDALLESQVLQRAELLVAVTEAMRNHLASAPNPNVRGKVILARNGIPNLGGSAGQPGSSGGTGPFRIVHAGSLYMGRNPTAFLTGLARFVARTPLSPGQLQVDFIGKCRKYGGRSVQSLIQDLGLSEIVHIEDWMPHGEVIALLRGADLFVLFAQEQPLQVPNKLYEYLALTAPVLAFVDRGGSPT